MSHNLINVNTQSPDRLGDITAVVDPFALAGAVSEITHGGSSNNASVGDYAQIIWGVYCNSVRVTSTFDFKIANSKAIKSNNNYFMGVTLKEVGYYYIEAVMKFTCTGTEYAIVQLVDSSNNAVGPKSFYGEQTRQTIYPSTIHAVINNQAVNSAYYFRVQALSGTVGQPTSNYGSSYFKCIKL